jgi:uncharacterized phiE125 gp8 family phage protein
MALKLITPPAVEPVSLAEAKLHLRVDETADDDLIRSLIQTCRQDIETLCLHALITQTWNLYLDGFPGCSEIELPWPPLQSVTGVYYIEEGGVEKTFASSNYFVDINSTPGKIVLKTSASWPAMSNPQVANPVRIEFKCGFGDIPSSVDYRAIAAIKLLLGHYYENREAVFMGRTNPVLLPMGVSGLCWDLRARMVAF